MPASRDSNLGAVPDGVHRHGDTGTDFPPRYDGPKLLSQALTQLTRGDEAFTRDGPRADVEYRDLGLAAASGGRIGVKHIRAIRPFEANRLALARHDRRTSSTCCKGSLTFRFAGVDGDVTVARRLVRCRSPPASPHNVVARSDDLEVIEINVPAALRHVGRSATAPARSAANELVTR